MQDMLHENGEVGDAIGETARLSCMETLLKDQGISQCPGDLTVIFGWVDLGDALMSDSRSKYSIPAFIVLYFETNESSDVELNAVSRYQSVSLCWFLARFLISRLVCKWPMRIFLLTVSLIIWYRESFDFTENLVNGLS